MSARKAHVVAWRWHPPSRLYEFGMMTVEVECPNGCRRSRRRESPPKHHHHGWAGDGERTRDGDRAAHCGVSGAAPYVLTWRDMPEAAREHLRTRALMMRAAA